MVSLDDGVVKKFKGEIVLSFIDERKYRVILVDTCCLACQFDEESRRKEDVSIDFSVIKLLEAFS